MEYKILIGILAVAIQLFSYLIYFRGLWSGKTKPHAFTWLVWGTLNVVAFAAVFTSGGGAGSWILAVNALCCLVVAGIGFAQRHVEYDKYDWLALLGAFVGIFLWWFTKNPLYAVLLSALSDAVGSIPIFRKAYRAPHEENLISFVIGMIYYPTAILALESLTLTTWLYPAIVFIIDGILVLIVFTRRKRLKTPMTLVN